MCRLLLQKKKKKGAEEPIFPSVIPRFTPINQSIKLACYACFQFVLKTKAKMIEVYAYIRR